MNILLDVSRRIKTVPTPRLDLSRPAPPQVSDFSQDGNEGPRKLPVNLKLDSDLALRLKVFADEKHTTQTYLVEEALRRLFNFMDDGGQLPLFPLK